MTAEKACSREIQLWHGVLPPVAVTVIAMLLLLMLIVMMMMMMVDFENINRLTRLRITKYL